MRGNVSRIMIVLTTFKNSKTLGTSCRQIRKKKLWERNCKISDFERISRKSY